MKISCVICSDLFVASAEVFITRCGHMFHHHCLVNWLERNETCPQCRHPATERSIHKVYFSVRESPMKEDIDGLINKVDVLMSDKWFWEYKLRKEEEVCQQLRLEVYTLEENKRSHNSVVMSLKEQILNLKGKCREAKKLREEVAALKQRLQGLSAVEIALKGSQQDVDNLICNEKSVESIALVATMLKKSLLEAQFKKRHAEQKLRKMKGEHLALQQSYSEVNSKYLALEKDQDYLRKNYEMEKRYLKRKIKEMKPEENSISSDDTLLQNISESPINVNRTLTVSLDRTVLAPSLTQDPILIRNPKTVSSNLSTVTSGALSKPADKPSISTFKFQVSSSSSTFASGKPYSILKSESNSQDHKPSAAAAGVSYDGLGGSSVEDIFPTGTLKGMKTKHASSNNSVSVKIRKVAPHNKPHWKP